MRSSRHSTTICREDVSSMPAIADSDLCNCKSAQPFPVKLIRTPRSPRQKCQSGSGKRLSPPGTAQRKGRGRQRRHPSPSCGAMPHHPSSAVCTRPAGDEPTPPLKRRRRTEGGCASRAFDFCTRRIYIVLPLYLSTPTQ